MLHYIAEHALWQVLYTFRFSTFIEDASADELGQVARRLNRMAQEFHDPLHTR